MDKRPLILVTGETKNAHTLARTLRAMGLHAEALPTIVFAETKLSFDDISVLQRVGSFDYVLFSSPRGVTFFHKILKTYTIPIPKKIPHIVVVGPASELEEALPDVRGKKILFPRSALASRSAPRRLSRRGAQVALLPLYTTRPAAAPRSMPFSLKNPPAIVVFLSASGVRGFSKQVRGSTLGSVAFLAGAVCLGPRVARAAKAAGFTDIRTVAPTDTL